MKKVSWGFLVFVVVFLSLFILGHLETDGKSTGLVLWDAPPAQPRVSDIRIDGDPKTVNMEVPRKNRPLFPRIYHLFHPNKD